LSHPGSAVCLVLATVSLPVLWMTLRQRKVILSRVLAGFQVLMVLSAWLWLQFPAFVVLQDAADLTLFEAAAPEAPEATIRALGWALVVRAVLILPALGWLLRVL